MYYMYHISGAVKRVEIKDVGGADLFSETLDYEDCGLPGCKPQYNGNISRMVHEMAYNNGDYNGSRDVQYVYDELNRLSKVKDSKQPMFDEMFEYDVQGRIVAQHRAKKTDGQYALNEHIRPVANTPTKVGRTGSSPLPLTWAEKPPTTATCPIRTTLSTILKVIWLKTNPNA